MSMNAAEEHVEPIRKTRIVSTYRAEDPVLPMKPIEPAKSKNRYAMLIYVHTNTHTHTHIYKPVNGWYLEL